MKNGSNICIDFKTPNDFEVLYKSTSEQLFNIIFKQIRDRSITEGLVQDIYLRLWERRFEIQLTVPIQHYLNRAAKLAALNYLKTNHRRNTYLNQLRLDQDGGDNITEKTIFFRDLKKRIHAITDQLPPKCRTVFVMSREEGLNTRTISQRLSIAEKTVEAHLTKALKAIRNSIERKV
ncbi:sigma-70 family RNA polymerase sigma factor [Sphingobacterium sp.]|uniref:sigma-70 family RNA polymerase sigma factor n=1 Tax=Sphingobacterium sp. TaxID=341027 RepID=UPI0028AAED48|nr:sigma-70 family RNA polymerase sigma factor [Sphingobacterium sp.]